MIQSHDELNEGFMTTNQDYGSFYFGRLQHNQINRDEIAYELSINNQVRHERRQLPSIAYDIRFDSKISADELAENMIAITVPHEYLGMPSIDPNQPYPGTEIECAKTPHLQRLLEHFQKAKEMVADSKQQFDSKAISSQPMQGVKYIYNPFVNAMPFRRL
ncbi:unnamed protein product [Rotaria sp. Silwood2]|nr:unnamed protein product [Rotaria sp. Silwood2]CAF2673877.1 unnamed protein product [Rotaria sp. Silwood2]CAF2880332.1 unnamed protein product [Rotaria sp. Silwood2]CAF3068612.1 unnamed protein product [Rotaria sp. Silwood2]CAF3882437.1 unnamed protein product [Rotaria sp. Silwood2]